MNLVPTFCITTTELDILFNLTLFDFQTGKIQAYSLGVYTRKRYENFLPLIYSEEDFYAFTTNTDRTHMSAQAYIAGLYPPSETEIWNTWIYWQPIPVHTVKSSLLLIENCPLYSEIADKELQKAYNDYKSAHEDVIEYIAMHAAVNKSSYLRMGLVYDALFIEETVGYQLPEWTKPIFPEPLRSLFTIFISRDALSDPLKRFGEYIKLKQLRKKLERIIFHQDSYCNAS